MGAFPTSHTHEGGSDDRDVKFSQRDIAVWLQESSSFSEKRRKPSPNAGGDIRRKARRALKISQVLTDSERKL